jgi:hypothetical protein
MLGRAFSFTCCLCVMLTASVYAGANDVVRVLLDWSAEPDGAEQTAIYLQQQSLTPIPMVFIERKPVALLGDSFELPDSPSPIQIDIGIKTFRERPLYSLTWTGSASSLEVSVASLAKYQPITKDPALLLEDVKKQKAQVVSEADGTKTINLPANPYASIIHLTLVTVKTHDWSKDDAYFMVYQRDPASGKSLKPIFDTATFNSEPSSTKAAVEELGGPYQTNVDVKWFDQFLDPLKGQKPEPLFLISTPTKAQIVVSGVVQADATNTTIYALRSLWPEIFVRREGYRHCQVDPALVKPAGPGSPASFECKLKK